MKVQYGFARLRVNLIADDNQLVGEAGDTLMYCRQDENLLCKVLSTKRQNGNYFYAELSWNDLRTSFSIKKKILFIAEKSQQMDDFTFVKDIVYQFEKNVFRAINSNVNPWNNESNPNALNNSKGATSVFFQRGLWIHAGDFKIINEKEANAYRKEYEKQMNIKKFDL